MSTDKSDEVDVSSPTYWRNRSDGRPPVRTVGPRESAADHEQVLADHRYLARRLDVALNGEAGAAKQASLVDIVAQVEREGIRSPNARGVALPRAVNPPEFQEATWGVDSVMRPCKSMAITEYAFRQWAEDVGIVLADAAQEAECEPYAAQTFDVAKFGTPGSQPPLVEAVLQTAVEFATVCERIGEGRGGERAPYRDAFYQAVARLAAAAGIPPTAGEQQ